MKSRDDRIQELLAVLARAQPAGNGLLAFRLISTTLNGIEDHHLGEASWKPPRRFGDGMVSERLYPSYPESIDAVEGWPSVSMITHHKQVVFIGSYGAFQFQRRVESSLHFSLRHEHVLLDKPDRWGLAVWDRSARPSA